MLAEPIASLYTSVETSIGRLLVFRTAAGIARIAFEDEREDVVVTQVGACLNKAPVRADAGLKHEQQSLSAYLSGASDELDLPVDWSLVSGQFRRRVLQELHAGVRRGESVTYGQLAARAGRAGAARAAGTACARNPVPVLVPCHRVLPSSGRLGAYGGGVHCKRRLLTLEGCRFS